MPDIKSLVINSTINHSKNRKKRPTFPYARVVPSRIAIQITSTLPTRYQAEKSNQYNVALIIYCCLNVTFLWRDENECLVKASSFHGWPGVANLSSPRDETFSKVKLVRTAQQHTATHSNRVGVCVTANTVSFACFSNKINNNNS